MKVQTLLIATLAVATVALAGCSGAKDDYITPEKNEHGHYVIRATAGNLFEPAKAKVPVGSTVVWQVGGGIHDVKADDGKSFDSDQQFPSKMREGDRLTFASESTGLFKYHCQLHAPTMVGELKFV